MYASSSKLKNAIEIWVGQAVFQYMDQNSQNSVLINYSTTVWPTKF